MRKRQHKIYLLPLLTIIFLLIMLGQYYPSVSSERFESGERPPVAREYHQKAYMPDQVIVKFMRGSGVESIMELKSFEIIGVDNTLPYGFVRLWIEGDVKEACKELMLDPSVEVAEPNYIRYLQRVPNDPLYYRQDNLKLSGVEKAWNIQTGDPSVVVAVIDTGCDTQHPDLIDNLLPGVNVRETGKDESDDSGHGTAVAGVLGAVGNNSIGIAGAAWNVKMLPIRACGGPGLTCSAVDIAKAIHKSIEHEVHIINMSLGGYGRVTLEETAVNDAWNSNIVLLAAVGNNTVKGKFGDPETESNIYYPAGYVNVIGVASVDYPPDGDLSQIKKSDFSNYGDAVSVTAVGSGVITTAPSVDVPHLIFNMKADYGQIDGTSFSTPLVSGMAALIKSHFPDITNEQLRARIEESVIDIGTPGWNDEFGYGLVDFRKAFSGSTHASDEISNLGVTVNPILNDEVIVIVKDKRQTTYAPTVSYSYESEGETKSELIKMTQLPNHEYVWSGRFRTTFSGNITIAIHRIGIGLTPDLILEFYKGRSN